MRSESWDITLDVCVVCVAFFVVRATLPETRGRTLESMDTDGV